MRRAGSLITVTALVATLALGACGADPSGGGGGSVSAAEKPYVDAMAASMTAEPASAEGVDGSGGGEGDDSATSDLELTDEQANCISSRFVDIITVERLEKAGIEPADLSDPDAAFDLSSLDLNEDEGNRLYDTFDACGFNLREEMTKSFSEGENPEMQACMEGIFTEENLRTLMVTAIVEGDEAMENDPALAPIMGSLMGCAFMGMEDMDLGTEGPTGGN